MERSELPKVRSLRSAPLVTDVMRASSYWVISGDVWACSGGKSSIILARKIIGTWSSRLLNYIIPTLANCRCTSETTSWNLSRSESSSSSPSLLRCTGMVTS